MGFDYFEKMTSQVPILSFLGVKVSGLYGFFMIPRTGIDVFKITLKVALLAYSYIFHNREKIHCFIFILPIALYIILID